MPLRRKLAGALVHTDGNGGREEREREEKNILGGLTIDLIGSTPFFDYFIYRLLCLYISSELLLLNNKRSKYVEIP